MHAQQTLNRMQNFFHEQKKNSLMASLGGELLKVNLGALKYDGTDSFYFQIFAPFSRKVELSK